MKSWKIRRNLDSCFVLNQCVRNYCSFQPRISRGQFYTSRLKNICLNENSILSKLPLTHRIHNLKRTISTIGIETNENSVQDRKQLLPFDNPIAKNYNPKYVEKDWYEYWEKLGIFSSKLDNAKDINKEDVFSLMTPPPNITGVLHIGHALTLTLEDILARYYRMKGKTVLFLPGFDHAGIATQAVVEKYLLKKYNKRRTDYSREEFVKIVRQWSNEHHDIIKNQFKKMGASFDWNHEAFTLDEVRSEAVITAFVKLFNEGIIYRASRLVNWSTRLNTAISDLEVDKLNVTERTSISIPGYPEKVEFGVLSSIAYPVDDPDPNESIIVSTTRPETIFGDTAIAIHPRDKRYEHLHGKYALNPITGKKIPIICDEQAVEIEFGTGAVKITPAHDQNDFECGKRNNLEFINIFTEDGILNDNCGIEWKGMKRFDARKEVLKKLKETGNLVEQMDHAMNIPICSRSGDVIEPLLKPQWWVSQKELAKLAIEAVESGKITISPQSSRAQYFHWLENIQDWCISRQLWWGHRCPAYRIQFEDKNIHLKNKDDLWVAGRTYEEALNMAKKRFPNLKYSIHQDEDVLDTWFSSSLWPLSTLQWPSKNNDIHKFYPFSILDTGWDILFFWVTRMILMCTKLSGQVPFKEVYCHSLIRDAEGRKMSKSLGNVIDPIDVINGISLKNLNEKLLRGNLAQSEVEHATAGQQKSFPNGISKCGVDALRFALCAGSTGARDLNLDITKVENYRRFCNKIYQATKFCLSNIDGISTKDLNISTSTKLERWMIYQINFYTANIDISISNRNFGALATNIYELWYLICDIFLEKCKYVFKNGSVNEINSTKRTLLYTFDRVLKLTHPTMPFVTEELWQRLPGIESKSIAITKITKVVDEDQVNLKASFKIFQTILNSEKEIRSILSTYNISKNAKVWINCEDTTTFEHAKDMILGTNKQIGRLTICAPPAELIASCLCRSVDAKNDVYVLIKGETDIIQQIKKIHKRLDKVEQSKKSLLRMMNNAEYIKKTSAVVQEKNAERLQSLDKQIETMKQNLSGLQKFK